MKEFFRSFFASLLAIAFVFVFVILIGVAAGLSGGGKSDIESGSYLVIDIYGDILPYDPPDDIVTEIVGGDYETLQRILDNLHKASVDDRITGVLLKISSANSLGDAAIEEIREAIHALRAADKKVLAYSDNMDRRALFLASACESIAMPASADVFFAGVATIRSYLRGTLDKLDIEPNLHKIDQYKSAAEMMLRKDMSPEAREMVTWILDDKWDVQLHAIGEDRKLTEEKLNDLMNHALFIAQDAKEAGLIDEVMYWDELVEGLKDGDDDLKTVSQSRYEEVSRSSLGIRGSKKIAVIHAHGTIGGRASRVDPALGMMMGHQTVGKELKRVRKDDDIAAVVFRIDSPGGESLASDLIAHQVDLLAKEKPVVASMIDVAASGGYLIAYKANKIIADPMTITGSIGSIYGKMNTRGLYEKLGISFDSVTKGPNGALWSGVDNFSDEQWKRFKEHHWDGFNMWLEDVSERRDIDLEKLKTLAMGRVWTGRQAVENGLIDELGGINRAIAVAKDLADIPEDEDVTIVHYPRKKSLWEMIQSGEGPKFAVRWFLYKLIREDVAESWRLLTEDHLLLSPISR